MKKIKVTFLCLGLIIGLPLVAQIVPPYQKLLETIEINNLVLKALQKKQKAIQLESKTNLFLDDPEINFGYLWGNPRQQGKRTNFGISQSFDFPTLYFQRKKQAQTKQQSAIWEYRAGRMQVLLEAQQLCVQLTYQKATLKILHQREKEALRLVKAYEKSYETGESNIIDRNKARLYAKKLQQQTAQMQAEYAQNIEKLEGLNGGKSLTFTNQSFDLPTLPRRFENWFQEAELQNPALQYLAHQLKRDQRAVKVRHAEGLPKFNVGYAQELVNGEGFKGITFGISIPLFKNKNKVKTAKARVETSQFLLEDAKQRFYNELRGAYKAALCLQKEAIDYRNSVLKDNSLLLLKKALQVGELSLINYLQEIDFFYTAIQQSLQAERDYLLAVTQLYRVVL